MMNEKQPFDLILFFDDNQINVDGARAVGMTGYTVSGVSSVTQKIGELGLLDPNPDKPERIATKTQRHKE